VDNDVSKASSRGAGGCQDRRPRQVPAVDQENTGKSYEDFKQDLKNNILTQKVVGQEVGSKINVPHEQVVDYYEKHKASFIRKEQVFLREILIAVDSKDPAVIAAAGKKAKDVVARARKGERFSDLVRDNSDALTAKTRGRTCRGYAKKATCRRNWWRRCGKAKGYVTDPLHVAAGFADPARRRSFQGRPGHSGGGGGRDQRATLHAAVSTQDPRVSDAVGARLHSSKSRRLCDTGAAAGKESAWQDPALLKPDTVSKEEVSTRKRKKKLLWVMPIPGTETRIDHTSSSRG